MTKKEAAQILAILKAAYPASFNGMTKEEASGTVSVWAMQFENMPVDIVSLAIHKCIATNKFPPTVAEVKEKIKTIHWEAYDAITMKREFLPESTVKKCQVIYDITSGYKYGKGYEPQIALLIDESRPLIGGCE